MCVTFDDSERETNEKLIKNNKKKQKQKNIEKKNPQNLFENPQTVFPI